jgi:IS66 C-terminal element
MDLDGLIECCAAPPNRRGKHDGDFEHKFHEGAVMVAYAMHLLRTAGTNSVSIHPDGMHGRNFDFVAWLKDQGFDLEKHTGVTAYGGTFVDHIGRRIIVNPKSGQGDVVAELGAIKLAAECKGGIINTAKLHELDPQAYLADVLERIVSGRTKSHQLHELLAWNWKTAHARAAQVAA